MRALLPIGVIAFIGAAATAACTATVSASPGFTVSPGVTVVTYSGGDCSTEDTYIVVANCGTCGATGYALCDGTSYTECSCSIPTGSGWVAFSGGGDDGGPEATMGDDGSGPEASSPDGGGDDGSSPGEAGSDDGGGGDDGGGSGGDSGGDS
jgi:hypothetical protein